MPINVNFDAPPTPPSSGDKTNFRLRYDAFLAYIQSLGAKLITFVTQINDLESNVNAKEASAVAASNIAVALTNYKGLFVQGTSSALIGESWTYGSFIYRCSVNTSNNPVTEPASWTPLSFGAQIHASAAKTTLVDADEFGIWDSASSAFKKVTVAILKTIFATLDSPAFIGTPTAKNIGYKTTLVSITSWSYVGTTITLNVASHTFVAGDYIEVSGLTATTYPANGVQLVTSVTATTIVYTLSATPTGTAGVSSATVKGYVTINGRISESIGVNQTWQDVSASRALETVYTNTTGKPIMLSVTITVSSSDTGAAIIIGSSILASRAYGNAVGAYIPMDGIVVPNGSTYKLSKLNAGNPAIMTWSELR